MFYKGHKIANGKVVSQIESDEKATKIKYRTFDFHCFICRIQRINSLLAIKIFLTIYTKIL